MVLLALEDACDDRDESRPIGLEPGRELVPIRLCHAMLLFWAGVTRVGLPFAVEDAVWH